MAIVVNLINGAAVTEDENGYATTMACQVSGLVGSPDEIVYAAMTTPGIPQRGDYHAAIPDVRVASREGKAIDAGTVEILVHYKNLNPKDQLPDAAQPAQIEVLTSIQEVETNRDKDDNLMKVTYNSSEGETVDQVVTVRKNEPQTIVRYSRKEPLSPGDKAKSFVGTVNAAPVFNDPERFWLCSRIDGSSDDGGKSYTVVYEFIRNRDTWDVVARYVDPATGMTPGDVTFGDQANGTAVFEVYPQSDFFELGI